MLVRLYQLGGVALLTGYSLQAFLGWELGNPILIRHPPPVGAAIARSGGGWAGRSSTYRTYSYSSSRTRSGVGGGGFGGK